MSRRVLLVLALAAAALGLTVPSASARSNLVVSAAAEPPDFELAGGRFQHSFTVDNQGRSRARGSRFGAFLSADPVRGGDIRLGGRRSVHGLRANRSSTRRATLRIPASVPPGFYYLIGCADVGAKVRESREGDNCRISGQLVGINASERGLPGPQGPAGPPGPNGRDIDRRRIQRTGLDLGTATVDLTQFPTADGRHSASIADEGSTQTAELARVGPITLRALCRSTTNGDHATPGTAFGSTNAFDEDGDEAKILVYTDAGTLNFSGLTGPRRNVTAGEGTPGVETGGGGEGQHQLIATSRDPDSNTTNGGSDRQWLYGFRSATGYIVQSDGWELLVHAYAGIDVLGFDDRCVFGGVVTVVKQPA